MCCLTHPVGCDSDKRDVVYSKRDNTSCGFRVDPDCHQRSGVAWSEEVPEVLAHVCLEESDADDGLLGMDGTYRRFGPQ